MASVLVIDDDYDLCGMLSVGGKKRGHLVKCASNAQEAIKVITSRRFKPDVIIVDIQLAEGSGIDVLRKLREKGIDSFAIVFSGHIQSSDLTEWESLKIFDSILKPTTHETLWQKIEDAADMTKEEGSLCDFLKGIIRRNEEVISGHVLVEA